MSSDYLFTKTERLSKLRALEAKQAPSSYRLQTTEEIEDLEKEIEEDKKREFATTLHSALLRLDYGDQSLLFDITVERNRPAMFILRGEADHGQIWLLNRLLRKLNVAAFTVRAKRRSNNADVAALWRELAKYLEMPPGSTQEAIADKLAQRIATQDVVLILSGIGAMTADYVVAVARDFWCLLAHAVDGRSGRRLLMFLIDEDGGSLSWTLPGARTCDDSWTPFSPVQLPLLTRFDSDLVREWVTREDELPVMWRIKPAETATNILEDSDGGLPDVVIPSICRLLKVEWVSYESRWMKYR